MNDLLEIEKIKQLKARYLRCLDTNDWESFADSMTPDCQGRYNGGKLSFDSRAAIVTYMRENLSGDKVITLHQGHQPEIEIVDEGTARGTWYLQDLVIVLEAGIRLYGSAIYSDLYRKVDGEWKIAETGYQRVFEAVEPLGEGHKITENIFSRGEEV
ncbi:nuclear transport factor 2 family protein [Parahaliea mediterranea]|uniref:Nuclear transport factor 2 family protein n=1 Tax=Parahaliea mediterranea TaxID=651086 RepID=A0A939DEX2_9GAMM|nr:nuclear transport factor 2 family protein [Parahaliea mediterranea]MBN7796973.1 nuclear transport factor 2 family protein [Parahaliea mediterranea]